MLLSRYFHPRKNFKNISLKSRLLTAAAIWLSTMILAAGVGMPMLVKEFLMDELHSQLNLTLDEITANLDSTPQGQLTLTRRLSDSRLYQPYSGAYWSISSQNNLLRSRSLWDKNLTIKKKGHGNIVLGAKGEKLIYLQRSIYLPDIKQPITITLGVDEAPLVHTLQQLTGQLWLILLSLFTGVLLLIGAQVSWSLLPLNRMQKELKQLRSGAQVKLSDNYPKEIDPLVSDLNALLFHYQEVLERARNHSGNLSHALKTPLSVLRNEVSQLEPGIANKLTPSLQQVQTHIDYHLSRARMAGAMNILAVKTSPAARVDEISIAFDKVFAHREIMLINELESELWVAADSADFDEMIGNILENSYKWATSMIRVYSEEDAIQGTITLCIEDDGPGIAPEDYHHVLLRGIRLDETTPGSGLGLNIVSEMAHSYRGHLQLNRGAMGGLKVELTLKRAIIE
ncbi:histidine kinase [Vibrio sp. 10N.286.49.B3]|uniref:ATP-binding protein n=1 Tax=Vibrio sp. 10N.286.49.B3 TaxID=1880855 RepID=UPI000C84EC71|nr:ATP-binding protein [Vibrio sp. 10N.286.49.B3]PMH46678.1 histidine kinase [Vibrio sp. 10N.286.49.B3]